MYSQGYIDEVAKSDPQLAEEMQSGKTSTHEPKWNQNELTETHCLDEEEESFFTKWIQGE